MRARPSAAHTRLQHRSHVALTVHRVRGQGEFRCGRGQVPPTRDVSTGHMSRSPFTASAIRATSARGMAKRRPHTTSAQATRRARWSQRFSHGELRFGRGQVPPTHASTATVNSAKGDCRPHTTSAQATRRAHYSQRPAVTANSVTGAAKCRPHTTSPQVTRRAHTTRGSTPQPSFSWGLIL